VAVVALIIFLHNSNSAGGRRACSIVVLDWQEEDKVMMPRTWHN
jgi:hypothetical protein